MLRHDEGRLLLPDAAGLQLPQELQVLLRAHHGAGARRRVLLRPGGPQRDGRRPDDVRRVVAGRLHGHKVRGLHGYCPGGEIDQSS